MWRRTLIKNKNKNKISKENNDNKDSIDKGNMANNNCKSKINDIRVNIDSYMHQKDKLLNYKKESNERRNNNYQKNNDNINNEDNKDSKEKDNISETSSFISNNRFINWTLKPKQSFQFLVHQASKNRDLSNSFHKYYESNKLISRGNSQAPSERDDYSINSNNDEHSVEKHKFRNLSLLKSYKFNEGDSFSSLNIVPDGAGRTMESFARL